MMMARFFAQRVIVGKMAYKDIPATLKPGVAVILTDQGMEHLIEK